MNGILIIFALVIGVVIGVTISQDQVIDRSMEILADAMGLTDGVTDATDAQKETFKNLGTDFQKMFDAADTTEEQKRELAELAAVIATLKTQFPQVGDIIQAQIVSAGGLKDFIDNQFEGGEDLMHRLQNQPDSNVSDLPRAIKDMKMVADAIMGGVPISNIGGISLNASASAEAYHCYFPCKYEKGDECSLFYHRNSETTFYEEKRWRIYDAQENEDHLLLIRNGFPTKDDLPEGLFVEIVHIDKFDNFKFMKNCVGNSCDEPLEPLLGKCSVVPN